MCPGPWVTDGRVALVGREEVRLMVGAAVGRKVGVSLGGIGMAVFVWVAVVVG